LHVDTRHVEDNDSDGDDDDYVPKEGISDAKHALASVAAPLHVMKWCVLSLRSHERSEGNVFYTYI